MKGEYVLLILIQCNFLIDYRTTIKDFSKQELMFYMFINPKICFQPKYILFKLNNNLIIK